MATQVITAIRTADGDAVIDYNTLANKPLSNTNLDKAGDFADALAVGNKISEVKTQISNINEQMQNMPNSSHVHSAENITSGTLSAERLPVVPVANGGTGAENGADGLKNLFAAGPTVLSSNQYGTKSEMEALTNPVKGQIFFVKV